MKLCFVMGDCYFNNVFKISFQFLVKYAILTEAFFALIAALWAIKITKISEADLD